MSSQPSSVEHRERMWPGIGGWSAVLGFALATGVAVWPVHPFASAAAAALTTGAGVLAVARTAPVVSVADGRLAVGRARIEVGWLGQGRALDRAGVSSALGPGSDARAFVTVRAWLPGAVEVPVHDPADPTPTWLISSRRPARLLAAIDAARAQAAHSEQIG